MAENETLKTKREMLKELKAQIKELQKELKKYGVKTSAIKGNHYYLTDLAEAEKQHIFYFSKLSELTQLVINRGIEERRINQLFKERYLRV